MAWRRTTIGSIPSPDHFLLLSFCPGPLAQEWLRWLILTSGFPYRSVWGAQPILAISLQCCRNMMDVRLSHPAIVWFPHHSVSPGTRSQGHACPETRILGLSCLKTPTQEHVCPKILTLGPSCRETLSQGPVYPRTRSPEPFYDIKIVANWKCWNLASPETLTLAPSFLKTLSQDPSSVIWCHLSPNLGWSHAVKAVPIIPGDQLLSAQMWWVLSLDVIGWK